METDTEAIELQGKLQKEAKQLLDQFKVVELLEPLGTLSFDGSYKYGLMTRRDIDINVYSDAPSLEGAAEVARQLFLTRGVIHVMAVNRIGRGKETPGRPHGIYLGPVLIFNDQRWTMDIWILKRSDESEKLDFEQNWTEEARATILLLKYAAEQAGLYPGTSANPDSIYSVQIYRAAADGVTTLDELVAWNRTHPNS